jgi:hypothetical protein
MAGAIAGLGHSLSAENDKPQERTSRWSQVIDLICLFDSIGLRLQIVPRSAIASQAAPTNSKEHPAK